jgi:hypothetical protein
MKLTSKPNFKSLTIFNKSLAGIEMKPNTVLMRHPIIVGFTVLELAKNHMYKFHFNYVKNLFGSDCELVFTDTDSLYYSIRNREKPLEELFQNKKYFDLSNFPPTSPFHSLVNKRRPGAFKHETAIDPVCHFIGLRSKMYATKHCSEVCIKKGKGLPRRVLRDIRFDNYVQALENPAKNVCKYRAIRSKRHALFTVEESKVSLSAFDDKRYLLDDGIHTLAHNHWRIHQVSTTH